MGVYVKGMEMPKSCSLCPFCFGANNVCPWTREYANSNGRHKLCPLVPVPKHGRLIDADALLDAWDDNHTIPSAAAKVIEKTIIPAEPPKDEAPAGPYDLLYEEGGYNSNGV